MRFAAELLNTGMVALGIVIGGSLFAGLPALLTGRMPLRAMATMAEELKLWGTFAALGGSFAALKSIETGLFTGELATVARHTLHVFTALLGAQFGYVLILSLTEP